MSGLVVLWWGRAMGCDLVWQMKQGMLSARCTTHGGRAGTGAAVRRWTISDIL